MEGVTLALVIVIVLALTFDYVNGFHDTATSVATSVATRALRPSHAIAMATAFNFSGAFAGTRAAVARLFRGATDAVDIIKWRDIYTALENTIDAAEDAVEVIERIVAKNAGAGRGCRRRDRPAPRPARWTSGWSFVRARRPPRVQRVAPRLTHNRVRRWQTSIADRGAVAVDSRGRPLTDEDGSVSTRRSRFMTPHPVAIRPTRGSRDLALVIEKRRSGLGAFIWDGATGSRTDVVGVEAAWGATLTPDGRWLIQLDDPLGTEVGHLHAFPVDGGRPRDLTPAFGAYVVRGLDVSGDGRSALATIVDASGFALYQLGLDGEREPRSLYASANEAWYGILSADAKLAAIDTTDHGPGIRRFAVSVVDTATAEVVAVLSDGPLAPVHRVRFSPHDGDPRVLVETERTGFARPCVWDPMNGARTDLDLPELRGDVLALDWDGIGDRLLLLNVDGGVHRLLEHHLPTGRTEPLEVPPGAYAEPDVADVHAMVFSSYYAPDGSLRLVRSRWDVPLHVLERREGDEQLRTVLEPAPVAPGVAFDSHEIASRDGTRVQLWVARPAPDVPIRGTVLYFHGGPNLATVDRYDASAQAWLDEGFAYAALNYRGSVTFGRVFREGFWGSLGDREIEDVDAAVRWLRDQGLADPGSLFATGESYGGMLTLLSLGRLPDSFAGGLAHVALADWAGAYSAANPALQAAFRGWIGGTPETAPERYARYSPISYVATVRAPVWLNQGRNDTRTPPGQAQKYADALQAAGGDVLLEWFEGGHGIPGLDRGLADQERMLELVDRRLRGECWSDQAETA